jgi:acyl dehydratase
MLYFEDIEIGKKSSFGRYEVTMEEVLEFANKYDPQAFHLDNEAAAKTHFGRISASGWHTCAMTMRMLVENMLANKQAGLGSPGVDEIRWLKPVYPGDTLRIESEILSKRQSQSKPEMGSIRGQTTVLNQNDEVVMTLVSIGLIRVRGAETPKP